MSKKRIYFNYSDFNIQLPKYPFICEIDTLEYKDNSSIDGNRNDRLRLHILFNQPNHKWNLLKWNQGTQIAIVVSPECGNCTIFSSNVKPAFWED